MKVFFKTTVHILLGIIAVAIIGFGIFAYNRISPKRAAKKLAGEFA